MEFGENDYKYILQEFSKTMIGARYTYSEIMAAERAPFKFQTIIDRLILPYADPDMMIGGHAASVNCILVTNNTQHFARMGIELEDWIQRR